MASTHSGPLSGGATEVAQSAPAPTIATTNPKMRKRTKTGCLTCRKRRIKCGEERPTCANCIKSKRQCEGYNQRVVFKPPIGDWPNHPGVVSTLQYHSSMLPQSRGQQMHRSPQPTHPQDPNMAALPPRAQTQFDFANIETPIPTQQNHPSAINTQASFVRPYGQDPHQQQSLHSPHHQQSLHSPHHQQQLPSPHHSLPTPTSSVSYFPAQSPIHNTFQGQYGDSNAAYQMQQRYSQTPQFQQVSLPPDTPIDQKAVLPSASYPTVSQTYQEQTSYPQNRAATVSEEQTHYPTHSNTTLRLDDYTRYAPQKPPLIRYGSNNQLAVSQPQPSSVDLSQAISYAATPSQFATDSAHSGYQNVHIPSHDLTSDVKYVPQHAVLGMSRI
jgi:hypothetical protein